MSGLTVSAGLCVYVCGWVCVCGVVEYLGGEEANVRRRKERAG